MPALEIICWQSAGGGLFMLELGELNLSPGYFFHYLCDPSKRFLLSETWFIFIFKDFIHLFLEGGGEGRKKERNINVWLPLVCPQSGTWPTAQACALDWESNQWPFGHRQTLNPLSHTSQGFFFIFRVDHNPYQLHRVVVRINYDDAYEILWKLKCCRY